jgi:hypothetical protein
MHVMIETASTAANSTPSTSDLAKPIGEEFKSKSIPTIAIFSHGCMLPVLCELPMINQVSHGSLFVRMLIVAIRWFLRGILGSSPARTHKSGVDNTSITELVYNAREGPKGGWFLMRFNDVAHLEGTSLTGDSSD